MYLALLILIFSVVVFGYSIYYYGLSAVSNDDELKTIVIESGSTVDSIATMLYDNDLIKNKGAFKIYIRLSGKSNLKAATYSFSEDMGTREIVDMLYKGSGINPNQIKVTFKEGLNMRAIAKVIESNTNHTSDEVYQVLSNTDYLRSLIEKYWFIDEAIMDSDIYYSLEGYLYPSTYYFSSKDESIERIIESMLDEMDKQLSKKKALIEGNSLSIHEVLTLASVVELEGVTLEDRKGIAGVFFNRLEDNMNLGSDVTTYYGAKIDMGERNLYASEVKECNDYNTRCATFKGLPVSPICNPSMDSIVSVLEPDTSNYYYFVADKNRKVYFSKNINEHNNTINRLKREGLWYEY